MSIHFMSQVWANGPDNRSHLLVLLALADFANDEGMCWPSIKSISKKARMTERGVQKIIRTLEAENWVKIDTGNGRHGCNNYKINPERWFTPEQGSPRTDVQETPNTEAETLNSGSPEPSRTFKEPSLIKKRARTRQTQISPDAEISDSMLKSAEKRGLSSKEAKGQFERFKASAIAKARKYANWDMAFVTWLDSPYFKLIYGGENELSNKSSKRASAFLDGARIVSERRMDCRSNPDPSQSLLEGG